MKRFVFVFIIALLTIYPSFLTLAAPSSYTIKYDFQQKDEPPFNFNLVNNDLSNFLALQNHPYLELNHENFQMIVGKQDNILKNDFLAETNGICGINTSYKTNSNSFNLLYGNNGQNIIAVNLSETFQSYHDLNFEALYFKAESPFWGIKTSSKISKNIIVSAETSENLATQAKGYLLTIKCGGIQPHDKLDLLVSYHYVEPTAISDYSANAVFKDSAGIRIETNYKLANNITLNAFQDFAQASDKSSKNANNVTLTWHF